MLSPVDYEAQATGSLVEGMSPIGPGNRPHSGP